MSTCGAIYNPEPTKAWYRVQTCTYPTTTLTSGADVVYSPYTRQYTTMAQAQYDAQMVAKGNILQYKANSANLTKSQKYAQLAKGFSSSRKNCYASQTETYTNPNVGNLRRVNSVTVPLETPNPNCDCSCNTFEDGGTLVCNETVNPCTGEVITKTRANELCYPSTASDVPGPMVPLCWYPYIQTWYPKQQLTMNTTTDKWPINAKNIGVAVKPPPPLLALLEMTTDVVELSWALTTCEIFPITSFNIYVNNVLRENISNIGSFTTILTNINKDDQIFMTSVSTIYESPPSNIVSSTNPSTLPYVSNNKVIHIDNSINNTNNNSINNTNNNSINNTNNKINTPTQENKILNNKHEEDEVEDEEDDDMEYIIEEDIEHNDGDEANEYTDVNNKNYKLPHTNKNKNKRTRINPMPNTLRHINSLMNDHTIARINNYVINYNKLMNDPNATFTMDIETFNDLNVGLSKLTQKNDNTKKHIEKNLLTYKNILKSMYQAFVKKQQYNDLSTASANWKKDSEILKDIKLLREYLEKLTINNELANSPLMKIDVEMPFLMIKPEYLEYHRLYGPPINGEYDADLLFNIINNKGV